MIPTSERINIVPFFLFLGLMSLCILSCEKSSNRKGFTASSIQDSIYVAGLIEKSKASYSRHPDSLRTIAEELLAFADQKNSLKALVDGNNTLGRYQIRVGEYEKAISTFKKNIKLIGNDLKGQAKAYTNMGTCYLRMGDFDLALDASLKGLKLEEDLNDFEGMAISYLNIAGIYAHLADMQKTIQFAKKAYEMSGKNAFPRVRMQSAFQLASVFVNQNKDSLAMLYADTTIRYAHQLNSSVGIVKAKSIKSRVLINQRDLEEALKVTREIGSFYKARGLDNEYLVKQVTETDILIWLGRYKECEEKSQETLEMALQLNEKEQIAGALKNLATAQSRLGKFKNAYLNSNRYHQYNDSIVGLSKDKAIKEIAAKYETEKKEAEIAALSQQSTIQALEIKQKNVAIWVGVVLVILIAGGTYLVNRQRVLKAMQAQMELEQRFLRSQLNPHFISNALLAVQNFMLKNQPNEASVYLSKFSKLMRETLENSRQEFILLEDEVQMLINFMDIHKMRMNDGFDYQIHIGDNIDPALDTIPPMFVQPFIENAIEHGIAHAERRGQIDLYFEKEGEYISILVKDNGKGYIKKESKAANQKSLSTKIIQERMNLFNKSLKNKIKLLIKEMENEGGTIVGTKVELKVPFEEV